MQISYLLFPMAKAYGFASSGLSCHHLNRSPHSLTALLSLPCHRTCDIRDCQNFSCPRSTFHCHGTTWRHSACSSRSK
ncbi:hypothetical protein PGT21_005547 [Puccinia graminis f. sp. tritici]|uniref:Uncharacterized protein n=1 Tax=Puccinia graminis f. sp. tritici TaxID=56615 RepID=A0A5B0QVQ1_PUCGR|nr:hypothetical protein PGT21_005547 [Puccinia graminis f. sp. tritici]